jgi:hypothetical protein
MGISYRDVVNDKGAHGEYLAGQKLKRLSKHCHHRILYNLYVPKTDGTTTEIDLLLLHPSGVYVVESKNYGGYIYGSATDRQWTAVLAGGKRKERFVNPIRQNQGHLSALQKYLPVIASANLHSLIIFSTRCTLAKVPSDSAQVTIAQRNRLASVLKSRFNAIVLTNEQIDWLFTTLQPLTQAGETIKAEHIARVTAIKDRTTQQRKPSSPH